jgi:murein DD-endopeptidase MepM/ murein hydrolase activator NlpD
MRFKAIDTINLRSGPSVDSPKVGSIPRDTIVESDAYAWKAVTLSDGTKGYCAANYLEEVEDVRPPGGWHTPLPQKYFTPSQPYLTEDWTLYSKFGHHTGVDYGGHGETGIPLFALADGEIIYRDTATTTWGASLGNHAALYVPAVDRSFLYCHMAGEPHALGSVRSGAEIGIMGNTGKSAGGAIHLHLEGYLGRFDILWRSFTSLTDIKKKTFDADQFLRARLV